MGFLIIEDEVREILEHNEQARGDDMALYAYYVRRKTERLNLGYSWLTRVFIDNRYSVEHGIAPYETISRLRRKVQKQDESLKPTRAYVEERKRAEKEYRQYFKRKEKNKDE